MSDTADVVLPELPTGWRWEQVGDLAAPEPRALTDGPFGSNLKTEHYTSAGPRVIRLQNIGDGEFIDVEAHISMERFQALQEHDARSGDIVIASLGEDLPRACVVPDWLGPAIVKADCPRLRPRSGLNAEYLVAALNSTVVRKQAAAVIHGVGRPRLKLATLKRLRVPIPPKGEQDHIVALLDGILGDVREATGRLRDALLSCDELEQSLFFHETRGEGATRWPEVPIGDVARIVTGTTPSTARTDYYDSDDVPFIKPTQLTGDIVDSPRFWLSEAGARVGRVVNSGAVLTCCIGATIGKVAIADRRVAFNQQINAAIFGDRVHPRFGLIYLRGMKHWLVGNATATALPQLNKSNFSKLPMRVPPLDIQLNVVDRVDRTCAATEMLRTDLLQQLEAADSLRASLLISALSGLYQAPSSRGQEPLNPANNDRAVPVAE